MDRKVANTLAGSQQSGLRRQLIFAVFLLISIVAVYWRIFKYPFIQDDWYIIDSLRSLGNLGYLSTIFSATENLFYRPIGQLYFFVIYNLSHLDPSGFHVAALSIHFCNSFLVVAIARKLTEDTVISWSAGFLYAVAITIHMDSMLWMVGIYDIGGAFFFFLALLLFIKRRTTLSAITYCLALFTKESTIILLPIIFLYQLCQDEREKQFIRKFINQVRKLWLYEVILIIYLLIRIPSLALVPIDTENPYRIQFAGGHIIDNISLFFKWAFEGLNPYFELQWNEVIIIVVFVILFIIIHRKSKVEQIKLFFLEGWLVFGLLPVIFLTNHFFRYYLTYSFPAFIIIILYGVRALASRTSLKRNVTVGAGIVGIAAIVISSSLYFAKLDRQGLNVPTIQGLGNLTRKGAVVQMVQNYLLSKYPSLPDHATIVFNWVPTVSFGRSIGPRIWYNDSTIHVYEVLHITNDSSGRHVQLSQDENHENPNVDPKNTILIKYHGDYIRSTTVSNFLKDPPDM
jgi:hypothetical protein